MKFLSIAIIAVLATAASAQYGPQQPQHYQQWTPASIQNKYSPVEAAAWHKCVDGFLDGFNAGHEGTKTTCAFWTCENTANQYSRGGALGVVGGAVNKACALSGLLPVGHILWHAL